MKTSSLSLWIIVILVGSLLGQGCQQRLQSRLDGLSESVELVSYKVDHDQPILYVDCDYSFTVLDDSLKIVYNSQVVDVEMNGERTGKQHNPHFFTYHAKISDIKQIRIVREQSEDYTAPHPELSIESLRGYYSFRVTNAKGYSWKESIIDFPIYKHADTTKFNEIIELLYSKYQIEDNYIAPKCTADPSIMYYEDEIVAGVVPSSTLDSTILLNASPHINEVLLEILEEYMKENDLRILSGTIVVNPEGTLAAIRVVQNVYHEMYKKQEKLSPGTQAMIRIGNLTVTSEQVDEIFALMSKEQWTPAKCGNQYIKSYIDFRVKRKE